MKNKHEVAVSRQEKVGDWAKGIGIVSLIAAFAAAVLDLFVVTPGVASVSFIGYTIVIGLGVALQFVGSAIPNMKFKSRSNKQSEEPAQPTELYRIDN